MDISVNFEYPHGYWAPLHVYNNFFSWFKNQYNQHNITFDNSSKKYNGNPSAPYSPHIMVIKNETNKKYIIVSYWDRAIEFTWDANGWESKNMVDIITSSGVHEKMKFTPFSYTCYSLDFEKNAEKYRKQFKEKLNKKLLFRGYLYADRKSMQKYKPDFFSEKRLNTKEYFDELNNSEICLSLNGAGEICNRDMEILSCGSVLLRPRLDQSFHDPLIENYHYISVEKVKNSIDQMDLLLKKYESVKNDKLFLEKIANNGLNWFIKNGSIDANVEILKRVVNIEKLN
jgi:hypothetical protein